MLQSTCLKFRIDHRGMCYCSIWEANGMTPIGFSCFRTTPVKGKSAKNTWKILDAYYVWSWFVGVRLAPQHSKSTPRTATSYTFPKVLITRCLHSHRATCSGVPVSDTAVEHEARQSKGTVLMQMKKWLLSFGCLLNYSSVVSIPQCQHWWVLLSSVLSRQRTDYTHRRSDYTATLR